MRTTRINAYSYTTIVMLCRYHDGTTVPWERESPAREMPKEMVLAPNTHLVRDRPDGGLVLFVDPAGAFTRVELDPAAATLWRRLDGRRNVEEVISGTPLPCGEALAILAMLRNRWAVVPATPTRGDA